MMTFGQRMVFCRKEKKLSGINGDIIGKYERNEMKPSIDIAKKIADAFGISLNYLVGEGQNAQFNKKTLQIIEDIEALDPDIKDKLYFLVNAVICDYKTQLSYKTI